ncbi:hypothetical protein FRC02_003022 [Tulasnella sp. 418]|nr:hypothetical protein FRC02_003022 [Tulasnella sp. 418]
MMFENKQTPESRPLPPQFTEAEYEKRTKALHDNLARLKLAEATLYAESPQMVKSTKRKKEFFTTFLIREVGRYIAYLVKTWAGCLKHFLFVGSIHPVQIFPVFIFASIGSAILGILLLWCIAARLPSKRLRKLIFGKPDKGAMTMFDAIGIEQVEAAKRALSRPIRERQEAQQRKVFNLDIAKFLCQLSSLMYQPESGHTLEMMEKIRHKKGSKKRKGFLKRQSSHWESGLTETTLGVDDPAGVISQVFDATQAALMVKEFAKDRRDSKISAFCRKFQIEYEPVSELNSSSAAFSSVFWDRKSNWIVVAFKGTGPTDFAEWVTDLDYHLIEGGSWLKGFGRVHSGFSERIFPRSVKHLGGRRPYDTISAAVSMVADDLKKNGLGEINVWMTGHSLGTAIASLAYARAVMGKNDFGKQVMVRDAYLFATPIICDVPSVHAFNWAMFKNMDKPRTMWRVTNRNDVVANGLPEAGDRPDIVNTDNLFCFAHLGTEIKLPDAVDKPVYVTGNHITQGIPVEIKSEFDDYALMDHRETNKMPQDWTQNIPLLGNGTAHAIDNYWNALSKVKNCYCRWVDD